MVANKSIVSGIPGLNSFYVITSEEDLTKHEVMNPNVIEAEKVIRYKDTDRWSLGSSQWFFLMLLGRFSL